jgi:hypothetical protein
LPGSRGFVAAGLQVGSLLEFVCFQFDVGGFCFKFFGAARGGDLEFVGDVDDVATLPACFFGATLLPMVMYLRILYMRFGPMPVMARKSSTLLKVAIRFAHLQNFVRGPRPIHELAAAPTP